VRLWDSDFFTEDDDLGYVDFGDAPRHPDGGGINLVQLFNGMHPRLRAQRIQQGMQSGQAQPGCANLQYNSDGSVTCQIGLIPLAGPGAGPQGGAVTFEISMTNSLGAAGAGGDPLVIQPAETDELLTRIGQVQEKMEYYTREWTQESMGFFLGEIDHEIQLESPGLQRSANSMFDSFGTDTRTSNMNSMMGSLVSSKTRNYASDKAEAQRRRREVWEYNQTLDLLNFLTSEKDSFVADASPLAAEVSRTMRPYAGVLSVSPTGAAWNSLSEVEQHKVAQTLYEAHEKVKRIEQHAGDPRRSSWRAFAYQDDYLPQIGIWSTDRRRKLRDQVFLAKILKLEGFHEKIRRTQWCKKASGVLFLILLIGFLIYGFTQNDWSFAGPGAGVSALLFCVSLCCCLWYRDPREVNNTYNGYSSGFGSYAQPGYANMQSSQYALQYPQQYPQYPSYPGGPGNLGSHAGPYQDGRGMYAKVMH